MPRYAWIVEYDGQGFCGWQKQKRNLSKPSVQQVFQDALIRTIDNQVAVVGASRTDAGVSARYQVVHAELPRIFPLEQLKYGLQGELRGLRISVRDARLVGPKFHAQRSAMHKVYSYQIVNRTHPPALKRDYGWWVRYPLDVLKMQLAADCLVGTHDFSGFRSKHCTNNPLKTITSIKVAKQDEVLSIVVEGPAFLMHQVRIIAGTLVAAGCGRITDIQGVLRSRDRARAGQTAPPQGLVLERIAFEDDPFAS